MRKTALLLGFLALSAPLSAEAGSKWTYWMWPPSHWKNQDFQPHLEGAKEPHNAQWQAPWNPEADWHPENWIRARGSADAVIGDFYRAGFIKEQTADGDVPVLVVGDAYLNLSGLEKRRVVEFIDYTYKITASRENGMFYLYHDRTDSWFGRGDPVGVYTSSGLHIQ